LTLSGKPGAVHAAPKPDGTADTSKSKAHNQTHPTAATGCAYKTPETMPIYDMISTSGSTLGACKTVPAAVTLLDRGDHVRSLLYAGKPN